MKVVVCGAAGKMGREVCKAVFADADLELVGGVDPAFAGKTIGELIGEPDLRAQVYPDLGACLDAVHAEVIVDFTQAEAAKANALLALGQGVHSIVGTTGIDEAGVGAIQKAAEANGANALIAPNFAIGAVLMMRFAEIAAGHLKGCEIIELHHDQKLDAPSGTALQTAKRVGQAAGKRAEQESKELLACARGADNEGIRIHSVRLPGFVAHQEVIFGGQGQTLTIRHDSIDRTSFMPGVIVAIKKIATHPGLTIGLDRFLDL